MFEDTYLTIGRSGKSIFRDRASKFIGIAVHASSEEDVKQQLAIIRKEYYDATHHCYAFRLGSDKLAFRSNDDGEPSGTAGKPILGQIVSKDLTNILLVVVRYYGGTKLGVSGLINAYRTAAREAIENGEIVEKIVADYYELVFEYATMNDVMKILKDEHVQQFAHDFQISCRIEFAVRKSSSMRISDALALLPKVKLNYISTR